MTRIIKELALYLLCLAAALAVNAYAIATFHTQWSELLTTFPITLAVALAFYLVLAILRAIAHTLRRLTRKRPASA